MWLDILTSALPNLCVRIFQAPSAKVPCYPGAQISLQRASQKESLSKVSVKEVSRTAKDRRAGSLGYAEALLLIYNKKPITLFVWKKYMHRKRKRTLPRKTSMISAQQLQPLQKIILLTDKWIFLILFLRLPLYENKPITKLYSLSAFNNYL